MRRFLPISLIALAVGAPSAPAADTVIAELPQVTPISARGATLAYSRLDEQGRWRLVVWQNGVSRDVAVPARDKPFDVDLGYYPGEGTVAAYSRCEGRASCDLFRASLKTGRETLLDRVSTDGADETRPSIHRGTVVFQRGTRLYFGGDGRVRRLRGGLPVGWDLAGDRLLTTWRENRANDDRTFVYLRAGTPGGRARELHRSASGLMSSVELPRPTIAGRYAFVAQIRRAESGQRFVRVDLRTGRRTMATARNGMQEAVPLGDRVAYVFSEAMAPGSCDRADGTPRPCQLRLTEPLRYR